MMRLSASVRLTWSVEPGPSTGGAGGLPPDRSPAPACGWRTRRWRSVDQDAQQDGRVIRRLAGPTVAADHRPQVETCDHVHHEARQMLPRKPFVHRRRHQEAGVPVDRAEVAHAGGPGPAGKRSSAPEFYPTRAVALSPTGC